MSSPPPTPGPDLGGFATALVVAASTMLFVGLFGGFVVLRGAAPEWPPAGAPHLPRVFFLATVVILGSSGTLIWSARERRLGRQASAARWLGTTVGAAVLFLLMQVLGGWQLARAGMLPATDNWGGGVYFMAGLHAAHALAGLSWLIVEWHRWGRSRSFRPACTFWHFVGVVWVAILLFFA
jgi:cytochrome c oxidase subunit 3